MTLWLLVNNFRATIPMRLNAPDNLYFLNDEAFLIQSQLCNHHRFFFIYIYIFSMPLFGWLVIMKTQNSYFAGKASTLCKLCVNSHNADIRFFAGNEN